MNSEPDANSPKPTAAHHAPGWSSADGLAHGLDHGLPDGLTEADMIDLVDGKLAPEREAAVLAALKTRPELALLVRQMRQDEAGLVLLRDGAEPPAELIACLGDRIEAQLHSEALAGLAMQEAGASAEPMHASVVTVRLAPQSDGWRHVLESPWTRRLATAASIAIVAGAGFLAFQEFGPPSTKALNLAGTDAGRSGVVTPGDDAQGGAASTLADGSTLKDGSAGTRGPGDVQVAGDAGPGTDTHGAEPSTPSGPVVATAITAQRALELAREGRLAISVRLPLASPETMKRLESIARAAGREGGWRPIPMDRVPTAFASLLVPTMTLPGHATPNVPTPIVVAADRPGPSTTPAPTTGPDLGFSGQAGSGQAGSGQAKVLAMWSVDVSPRAATLSGLLDAISPGRPEGAVFVERVAAIRPAPSMLPEDVLWWQNPPTTWGLKVVVPVVVEGVE